MKGLLAVTAVAVLTTSSDRVSSKPIPLPPEYGQGYQYVVKVNVGEDNYLYINVKGNFSNAHGCSQPWFARSQNALGDARTQPELAVATSWFLSRRGGCGGTQGCPLYGCRTTPH